jgi:hypothetical protein
MAGITEAGRQEILALYVGMFKAVPNAENLALMTKYYEAGASLFVIARLMVDDKFTSVFPTDLPSQDFADRLVTHLLGGEAGDGQIAWARSWMLEKLAAGDSHTDLIVRSVSALLETDNANYANAQAALKNKAEVAKYYALTKEQKATDLATLQDVIAEVSSAASSVTAAKSGIDTAILETPYTFTLTTDADTFTGNIGKDTFHAKLGTGATLSASDRLDGGGGVDTIIINDVTGAQALPSGLKLTNIEVIRFQSSGTINLDLSAYTTITSFIVPASGGPITLNVSGNSGLTTIDASLATGVLTVTAAGLSPTTILGGSGNDVLTASDLKDVLNGGAGDDRLAGGTGLATMTGGTGNDTFVISTNPNVNTYTTITDASAGDRIALVNRGIERFGKQKAVLADTAIFQDYANAVVNAGGNSSQDGYIGWFQYGGNTFIVESRHNASTDPDFLNGVDVIVKLTGLVDLTDVALNFEDPPNLVLS